MKKFRLSLAVFTVIVMLLSQILVAYCETELFMAPAGIVKFSDSADNITNWTVVDKVNSDFEDVSEGENNMLQIFVNPSDAATGSSKRVIATAGDLAWKDYTFTAKIKMETYTPANRIENFGMMLRYNNGAYYTLNWSKVDEAGNTKGTIGIAKNTYSSAINGTPHLIYKKALLMTPQLDVYTWNTYRVSVTNNNTDTAVTIKVFLNDIVDPVLEWTDTSSPILTGKIGIYAHGSYTLHNKVWFDDLSVVEHNNILGSINSYAGSDNVTIVQNASIKRETDKIDVGFASNATMSDTILPNISLKRKDTNQDVAFDLIRNDATNSVSLNLKEKLDGEKAYILKVNNFAVENDNSDIKIFGFSPVEFNTVEYVSISNLNAIKANNKLTVTYNANKTGNQANAVMLSILYKKNTTNNNLELYNIKADNYTTPITYTNTFDIDASKQYVVKLLVLDSLTNNEILSDSKSFDVN